MRVLLSPSAKKGRVMSVSSDRLLWEAVEFVPGEASASDWAEFHRYRRIRHEQRRPEDPLLPDDLVEKSMKREDPFGESVYYGVVKDGAFISLFSAGTMKPAAPSYENNKHILWAGASVLPEHRRQGIGRMWIGRTRDLFDKWPETRVLTVTTEEDEGHAFLKWLGAEGKWTGAENRLKWKEIDWDMVREWVEDGPRRAAGAHIELYEDRVPESLWEEYLPVYTALGNLAPREDLDMGDWVSTPENWREMYSRADEQGDVHHTMLMREADGTISGLTEVWFNPAQETLINQDLTGVVPEFRGRGLGKWLKGSMLDYVRGRYAGIDWVVTGNANSNAPMLSINHRLGFKEYKGATSYQISKDDLMRRVESF